MAEKLNNFFTLSFTCGSDKNIKDCNVKFEGNAEEKLTEKHLLKLLEE